MYLVTSYTHKITFVQKKIPDILALAYPEVKSIRTHDFRDGYQQCCICWSCTLQIALFLVWDELFVVQWVFEMSVRCFINSTLNKCLTDDASSFDESNFVKAWSNHGLNDDRFTQQLRYLYTEGFAEKSCFVELNSLPGCYYTSQSKQTWTFFKSKQREVATVRNFV